MDQNPRRCPIQSSVGVAVDVSVGMSGAGVEGAVRVGRVPGNEMGNVVWQRQHRTSFPIIVGATRLCVPQAGQMLDNPEDGPDMGRPPRGQT